MLYVSKGEFNVNIGEKFNKNKTWIKVHLLKLSCKNSSFWSSGFVKMLLLKKGKMQTKLNLMASLWPMSKYV